MEGSAAWDCSNVTLQDDERKWSWGIVVAFSGKRTPEREGERFSSSMVISLSRWFLPTEENVKEKNKEKKKGGSR
jgi:hypothetical protein